MVLLTRFLKSSTPLLTLPDLCRRSLEPLAHLMNYIKAIWINTKEDDKAFAPRHPSHY